METDGALPGERVLLYSASTAVESGVGRHFILSDLRRGNIPAVSKWVARKNAERIISYPFHDSRLPSTVQSTLCTSRELS